MKNKQILSNLTMQNRTCIKKFEVLLWVIFTTSCLLWRQECFSQPVQATTPETNYGVTANGRYTGNDILDFNSDRFEVSVWEDVWGNSGFGWNMFNGINNPGTVVLIYADAQDPDVSLVVDNNGIVHALIVYYSYSGQGYYLEIYDWDPLLNQFALNGPTPLTLLFYTTTFGTAINIDADWQSNFVIVFDDAGGFIWALTGDMIGSSLTINNSGTPSSIGSSKGSYPDVCIFEKSGSDRVTYCYIDNTYLNIDHDSFSSISSGTNTSTNIVNSLPSSGMSYISPRIACPNINGGNLNDWTTVVLESDFTTIYNIQVFNWDNAGSGLTGPFIVNDASFTSNYYASLQNFGPVVAYNNQTTISIGWNVVDPLLTILNIDGTYPIVTNCNMSALPIQTAEWDVPDNLISTYTMDYLSLSGRYTNDALFCTFNVQDVQDVYYKTVPGISGASSLRSQIYNDNDSNINYFNDNNDEIISGTLFDISGNVIYKNSKISYFEFNKYSANYIKNKSNSIYLMEIISNDGNHTARTKFFNSKD